MNQINPALQPLAVSVNRLSPLPGNPRKGDVNAVARSYAKFGQRKPIVARVESLDDDGQPLGIVIAGNHQLAAAKKLGWDEIAVVWVYDDDLTAKAFALADNKTSDLGDYDNDAIADFLADLTVDDSLLAATGFSSREIAHLLGENAGIDYGSAGNEKTDFTTCPSCGYEWNAKN